MAASTITSPLAWVGGKHAAALNATPALVALSYYEHPLLDDLYPKSRWRRMTWTQAKAIEMKQGSPRTLGRECY